MTPRPKKPKKKKKNKGYLSLSMLQEYMNNVPMKFELTSREIILEHKNRKKKSLVIDKFNGSIFGE